MGDDYDYDDGWNDDTPDTAPPKGRTTGRNRDCRRAIEDLQEARKLRRLLEDELDF